jgi:hypothetical protein
MSPEVSVQMFLAKNISLQVMIHVKTKQSVAQSSKVDLKFRP